MKSDREELLESIKKDANKLIDDISKIDVEKETGILMEVTEKALLDLGDVIRKKREEMNEKGMEETIKKDIGEVEKGLEKIAKDIKENLG